MIELNLITLSTGSVATVNADVDTVQDTVDTAVQADYLAVSPGELN